MTDLSHNELAHSLALHLSTADRMAFEDIVAGPAGSCRPDVYTLKKSWANPDPLSYEIKISRSDFLSDINAGKWRKYLDFSEGVVFATPKGLISKKELPSGVGLMQLNNDTGMWRTVKKPRLEVGKEIPSYLLLKLLMDGADRLTRHKPINPRSFMHWKSQEKLAKKFGEETAKAIAELKDLNVIKIQFDTQIRILCDAMNCEVPENFYEIKGKIQKLVRQINKPIKDRAEAVDTILADAVRNLEHTATRHRQRYGLDN